MNEVQAKAMTIMLSTAGFDVEVICNVHEPRETAYSLFARKEIHERSWMYVHLLDEADAQAFETILTLSQQPGSEEPNT